jgi:hypothetical protein
MNCRHAWDRAFLDTHLSRTWREGELSRHRAGILYDRERSLMPATQPAVEIERQKRTAAAEIAELDAEAGPLRARLKEIDAAIEARQIFIRTGRQPGAPEQTGPKERRQFVAACPAVDCRGFLSTAYKCGTCATQFCADCREPTQGTAQHTCDPALKATMTAIAQDTRGCPNCGTGISKVSGCDQMYCTNCDTAFSWATGKVVTGVIHNPHYFERVLSLKGSVPRQPGDELCGGWPVWTSMGRKMYTNAALRTIYQAARHVEQVILPYMPTGEPPDNTDLRVRYLLKEIDEKRLKQLLQQRDRKRQRDIEIRGPLELFVVTTLEFFLTHRKSPPTPEQMTAVEEHIETHVNAPLRDIGDRYANNVPQITKDGYAAAGYKPRHSS